MFKRKLAKKEVKIIEKVIDFVECAHDRCEGHDYSHVLEVTKHAIEIGKKIREEVDPFVIICGALLHDIGRINSPNGLMHGLDGGSRSEEFLESFIDDEQLIVRITRTIVRHTPKSMVKPETAEQKIIFDADTIDRLGLIGMIRGVMGKTGTIEGILVDRIHKRLADFNKLYFKVSRQMAKKNYTETLSVAKSIRSALAKRTSDIRQLASYKMLHKL